MEHVVCSFVRLGCLRSGANYVLEECFELLYVFVIALLVILHSSFKVLHEICRVVNAAHLVNVRAFWCHLNFDELVA